MYTEVVNHSRSGGNYDQTRLPVHPSLKAGSGVIEEDFVQIIKSYNTVTLTLSADSFGKLRNRKIEDTLNTISCVKMEISDK